MGQHVCRLSCDRCTGDCSNPQGRCASLCYGPSKKALVVQTFNFESGKSPQIAYPVVGEERTVNPVCGDFLNVEALPGGRRAQGERGTEAETRAPPQEPSEPAGSQVPNVRPREEIEALRDEFRHNAFMVGKIRKLADEHGYTHWRPIRGDGNCFYRAAVFGVLEAWFSAGAMHRVMEFVKLLQKVRYEEQGEQCAHEEMLKRLQSWDSATELEHWVAMDSVIDQALVRACRRILREHLVSHAEAQLPNGMTYLQYVLADSDSGGEGDYRDVEDYCSRIVDPMGREAEFIAVAGFPASLGIGVRIWLLDRRGDVDLTNTDWLGPSGNIDVHLLLKPGHYDLLIPGEGELLN